MNIRGEYRNILRSNGNVIADSGWKPNTIVEDYGLFLAALMKKDFTGKVGIEFMAVGSGSGNYSEFKKNIKNFFDSGIPDQPYESGDVWVWAKKIEDNEIKYIDISDNEVQPGIITNKLKIDVLFGENVPSEETLEFDEFALFGIDRNPDGSFNKDKIFLINYVDHGPITKDKNMELTRSVKLTFPTGGE